MIRRPVAFVLATLVMAIPIARQLCEAACADSAIVEHTSHHHHSSATSQTTPEGATVGQLSRACVVLDAIVTDSREGTHLSGGGPAAKSIYPAPSDGRAAAWYRVGSRHALPPPIRSLSPLRI